MAFSAAELVIDGKGDDLPQALEKGRPRHVLTDLKAETPPLPFWRSESPQHTAISLVITVHLSREPARRHRESCILPGKIWRTWRAKLKHPLSATH